jgi:WD40 repeat protein
MTYSLHIIITTHFLIAAYCAAMEQSAIQNIRQALFVSNNRVILSHQHGCSIIDLQANKEIIKVSNKCCPHLALNHDTTKVAVSSDDSVKIYSTKTGDLEWNVQEPFPHTPLIASSIFSPLQDAIFISYENMYTITKHIYEQHPRCCILPFDGSPLHSNPPTLAFHPKGHQICVAHNPGDISIYNNATAEQKTIVSVVNSYPFCAYSPDGNYIAAGDEYNIFILNPHKKQDIKSLKALKKCALLKKKDNQCIAMAFHPNSAVLTTLSKKNGAVQYWNVATRRLITTMPPLFCYDKKLSAYYRYHLSFSSDGENIVITYQNNYHITSVPFEVIYQDQAKSKSTFAYLIFKSYLFDKHSKLPHEIVILLMRMVLETLKR